MLSELNFRLITQRRNMIRFIPPAIKDPVKRVLREMRLRYCLRKLRTCTRTTPPLELVLRFREAWGNMGFSADADYLLEAVRLAQDVAGPVLECGCGLSTILLAALGIEATSLEHDPAWARGCQKFAKDHGIRTDIIYAPLVSYGDFEWYEILPSLRSPALVLCDGPPAATRGGRYGLLPVLGDRLGPACVILMDDGERLEDFKTAQRWASEFQFSIKSIVGEYGTMLMLER